MRERFARLLALLLCLQLTHAYANELGDPGFGEFGRPGFMNVGKIVNNLITPFFSVWLPVNNTSTWSGGFASSVITAQTGINASTTVRRVPIPFAATLSGLSANLPVIATTGGTGATVTTNINGVAGNLTCAYALVTPFSCSDTTHTDVVNPGDLIQYTFNPHGGTWAQTASTPGQISVLATGAGQQGGIVTGSTNSDGVTTTTEFINPGSGGFVNTTEIAVSGLISVPGQITSLYALPNGADTGANVHTYTVFHNGVAAPAMSCVGAASTAGCCVNLTSAGNIGGGGGPACGAATAISIAAYDTISIQVTCGGTCSTINPAFGLGWQPSNKGQAPLIASGTNVQASSFLGVAEALGPNPLSTNTAYDLAPALTTPTTMTFSNYVACTSVSPGGAFPAVSRTAALQFSSTTAPPTTAAGPTATFGTGVACPNTTFPTGFADTTHTFVAQAGYTIGSALTLTGASAGSGFYKVGMAVTVP